MGTVVTLVAEGFEDSELTVPVERLAQAGHHVVYAGESPGVVSGKHGQATVQVEIPTSELKPGDYDALLIPGGKSPARLCTDHAAAEFVHAFFLTGKPVAAICHGPLLLVAAGVTTGKTLTSWSGDDVPQMLVKSGAVWRDEQVVVDGNLVTSRKPDDLDAFCREFLALLQGEAGPAVEEGGMLRVTAQHGDYLELLARGKLTRTNYEAIVPLIEAQLKKTERLRALIVLEDFHGWTPGGLWEDLKFDLRHRKEFERIAVVGEGRLEEWGTRLSQPFFSGEVRFFDRLAAARAWIEEGADVASASPS